jgi:pPIWI_RE module N-terminal domain/MID domain of pPIWI_RE
MKRKNMPINEIRTLAFRLPENKSLEFNCRKLVFPQSWDGFVADLSGRPEWKQRKKGYPPKKLSLKKLLYALSSDLIYADDRYKPLTIYSHQDIKSDDLLNMSKSWIENAITTGGVPLEICLEYTNQMLESELKWDPYSEDLAKTTLNRWQTAEPHPDAYNLLPELIAQSLSAPNRVLWYGEQRLHFYRAPSPNGKGVELISWQPISDANRQDFYSVYINISFQTVSYQSFPVLHTSIGLRRWVSRVHPEHKSIHLEGGRNHSVYLLTNIAGEDKRANRFQLASIRYGKRLPGGKFPLEWQELLPELFKSFFNGSNHLPDLESLKSEPLAFTHSTNTQAAIVFDKKPFHNIGTGVMPHERRLLFEQIAEYLENDFGIVPVEMPHRVTKRSVNFSNVIDKISDNEIFTQNISGNPAKRQVKGAKKTPEEYERLDQELCRIRREAVSKIIGEQWCLEIYYRDETTRKTLIGELENLFGLKSFASSSDKSALLWNTPEMNFEVKVISLGELNTAIDRPLDAGETQKAAFLQRVNEIRKTLAPVGKNITAIVEIPDKRQFKKKDWNSLTHEHFNADPKEAIRAGYGQSKRLAQCISSLSANDLEKLEESEKSLPHRAQMAILDSLRQYGVYFDLKNCLNKKIFPRPVALAAFWIIKTTRNSHDLFLPILLYIPADGSGISVNAEGSAWKSYPDFLTVLAEDKVKWLGY